MTVLRTKLLHCSLLLFAGVSFSLPLSVAAQSSQGKSAHRANPQVKFVTTDGAFTVELNAQAAPNTVANFLQYVREKHYSGTIFHRVIKTFMIQGGGYDANYNEKPTHEPVKNEANNGLKNTTYTIAMARTSDPNSATSQFFINTADNDFLNYTAPNPLGWGYTVFGKVISGENVVDKIANTPTGSGGPFSSDVPQTPIVIESATIVN